MTKSNLAVFFILLLLSLSIVFFDQSRSVSLIKNYLNEILWPFETVLSGIANKLFFWQDALLSVKNLKESNKKLIKENLELYGRTAKLAQLEKDNELLREKWNLADKNFWDTSLANVIGRDFENNRSFAVNKGVEDGIAVGMPAILQGQMLVGKISDAGYNTSKVRTIIDAQSKVAAITSESRISGLVRGLGSDVIFDLISKDKMPKAGELIVSSGTDGLWPRGLVIGKIKQINSEETLIFNTANIELLADFRDFDDIFIIINFPLLKQ